MHNVLDVTPERLQQVRERLHLEDPTAEVRPSADVGSIEVSSDLPQARVTAILQDVFQQGVKACGSDEDDAGGEGCCGCCGD